jgi:hypothetical protein
MNKLPRSNYTYEKQLNNHICQGFGCYQNAIVEVNVKVGKFGTHTFRLCSSCAKKLQ